MAILWAIRNKAGTSQGEEPMRTILLLAASGLVIAGCKPSVSLTNASPEEVAKAAKENGIGMNPGQWETTVEIVEAEMPGLPKASGDALKNQPNRVNKHSYCITPEEAAHPGSGLFAGGEDAKGKCKVEKFSMSGGHIEQTISCADPNGKPGMTMSTTGTYTGDSMTGTANMEMGGFMKMKVNLTSKRVGECKAGAK